MKQLQSKQPGRKYLALAFLLPFLGYSLVMLVSRYSPFGSSSILYSDMYHQYYPFFVEFRRVLRSGGSLVYNWHLGLGVDYLALIAYYVASPLNLLSVLVPEGMLLGFFSMLVPVKLGLSGLFFAIFLDRIFHRRDWSLTLFSCSYALCAWALGYQWNIMWLDTFALLPLVILGMLCLLQRRRFFLYTITLFLSIASNYYIGLFTCIFVALCFFSYEICYGKGFRRFWGDLGVMLLFSLLAIALTAFLEWPAYVALGTTNSSVNQFPTTFSLNIAHEASWMGLLDAMRQVAGNTAGGLEPTFKEGLPNLYCGILPLLLVIQLFASKEIKLREKLCCLGMLLFFMLSFIIRQLDYIWHGFHFTNMIPYRFSFLFSFVVLVMAYRSYGVSKRPQWRIILSMIVFLHRAGVGRLFGFPAGSGVFGIQPGVLRNLRRPAFVRKAAQTGRDRGRRRTIRPNHPPDSVGNRPKPDNGLSAVGCNGSGADLLCGHIRPSLWWYRRLQLSQWQTGHCRCHFLYAGHGGRYPLLPGGIHAHPDAQRRRAQWPQWNHDVLVFGERSGDKLDGCFGLRRKAHL